MKIKKIILISFVIVFVSFSVHISNAIALVVPKANFPTVNPIPPKPENIGPNISDDGNSRNNNYFYLNKEGNYQEPVTEIKETENNTETPATPIPETNTSAISPTFLIIIITIISFILFYLYRKVIHKNSF